MQLLDLFSGIGGFSLGLERSGGFRTVAFCEIEPYCRAVLRKHWPAVPCYDDVRTLTAESLAADGISVDAICGGFPCQDISDAGKRAGITGTRSGLWSEFHRLIAELKPRFAIIENVAALRSRGLETVLQGLNEIGYCAQWHCIPAGAVGAHFVGDRIWIVASRSEADGVRLERQWTSPRRTDRWQGTEFARLVQLATQHAVPAGRIGRVSDGLPRRAQRLRALGNAVVPEIPQQIGEAIMSALSISLRPSAANSHGQHPPGCALQRLPAGRCFLTR